MGVHSRGGQLFSLENPGTGMSQAAVGGCCLARSAVQVQSVVFWLCAGELWRRGSAVGNVRPAGRQ